MSGRVVFPNKLLPYLLLAPQLAITAVFFYWPASQAVWLRRVPKPPPPMAVDTGWRPWPKPWGGSSIAALIWVTCADRRP